MRYIYNNIIEDLSKKMVFIGGPRQCGKTTLAKHVVADAQGQYLNWDDSRDRKIINKHSFDTEQTLVVFDELHKKPKWKNWIKGLYDTRPPHQNYLVTGSARLDVYRRGGDSLLGRYHYWRLHPFTIDEYSGDFDQHTCLQRLMTVGGFPEPFLNGDERQAKRWRRERFDRILRDDIRDLENIRMINSLSLLVDLLRERVSSSIVMSNLAEDIQVAPKTVQAWIAALERMYVLFVVKPYTHKVARAIQRPPRIYFYDNMDVDNPPDKLVGARFENLVATHLLKRLQYLEDFSGDRYELSYLRDKDQREVDFVITKNRKIEELVEVKYSDEEPSTSLIYYKNKLGVARATQILYHCPKTHVHRGVKMTGVLDYFKTGPWDSADAKS